MQFTSIDTVLVDTCGKAAKARQNPASRAHGIVFKKGDYLEVEPVASEKGARSPGYIKSRQVVRAEGGGQSRGWAGWDLFPATMANGERCYVAGSQVVRKVAKPRKNPAAAAGTSPLSKIVILRDGHTLVEEWRGTLGFFLKANTDDPFHPDEIREMKALKPGQKMRIGGGAGSLFVLQCARVQPIKPNFKPKSAKARALKAKYW